MDDDRRPLLDDDVDPDATSVWDLPLAPAAPDRASPAVTEIAAARALAADDERADASDADVSALIDDDDFDDSVFGVDQDDEPPATEASAAPEPPAPSSQPGPSGGMFSRKTDESEWTRFSRALGGSAPSPDLASSPDTDDDAGAVQARKSEADADVAPPEPPPATQRPRASFLAEGQWPLAGPPEAEPAAQEPPPPPLPAFQESPPSAALAPPLAPEWEQFEAALGVRLPPQPVPPPEPPSPSATQEAPPSARHAPAPGDAVPEWAQYEAALGVRLPHAGTTAASSPEPHEADATTGRRGFSRGLILFGVVFGLALVALGALVTSTLTAPTGSSSDFTLLVWLASVAVAGALVGGSVVALVLLRRTPVPARPVVPQSETPAPSGWAPTASPASQPLGPEPTPAAAPPPPPLLAPPDLPVIPASPAPSAEDDSGPPAMLRWHRVSDDAADPARELSPVVSPLPADLGVEPSPDERFVPPRPIHGTAMTDWAEGDVIADRYRIARKIVSGMGIVYLCHDALQRVPVAVKTYRDLDGQAPTPDGRQRDVMLARLFEAEALIWMRLGSHPNIVEAQYVVELHGKPHLFLELVSGPDGREQTLRQLVKAGPQEPARVIRLGLQVCAGLEHATSVFPGLVHRDLKPENLLLADNDVVKVTDFGLTRVFADVSGRVAALAGTPAYMSPEQCLGLASLDSRADVYALGVILYELLTGRRPFLRDFLQAHLTEAPTDPRQHIPEIPEMLADIVLRCLAKRPEERYVGFAELRSALADCYVGLMGEPAELPAAGHQTRTERQQASIDLARAISLTTLGRYDEAVELLNRAVLFDPGYAEAWRWRGIGLTALGQLTEAAACFTQAVTLAPEDIDAWIEQGRLSVRLGQRDDAIESFNSALAINPEHIGARYERGVALFFLGQYAAAAADLTWANTMQPGPALQAAEDAATRRMSPSSAVGEDSALDGLPALISVQEAGRSQPQAHVASSLE